MFAGVSDIFKTPANNRRKSAYTKANECPVTPHGVNEMSVMNTPEESGKQQTLDLFTFYNLCNKFSTDFEQE